MARRYGEWAGRPKGYPEDLEKCVAEVAGGFLFYQCSRKRGHGPNEQSGIHVYVPSEENHDG